MASPACAVRWQQSGPRRMQRRPDPESAQPLVQLSGRRAERLARELAEAQLAASQPAGNLQSRQRLPVRLPRRAWRFRRHLQPFIWLALLLAAGAGLHAAAHPAWWGPLTGLAVPALMLLAAGQRHKDKRYIFSQWTRRFAAAQAAATGLWLCLLALAGLRACAPWVLLTGAPFLALWVRHYRWRPDAKQHEVAPADDLQTWGELVAEQKWRASLGAAEQLPGGGRKYPVQCDGIKTTIKKVLALPDNVAGAWHKPVTECYAERDPQGVTSRGYLTILGSSTLQTARDWNGRGMDLATGLAVIGRFADGKDACFKMYTPRFGTRHALVSGTTGSGKSALLDQLIFIALTSGCFVPVILDPQEGQSLPFWQDRCIYASGVSQVEKRLRGLHAGMLDRSQNLSTWRWDDDGIEMPGMPFFDYELTGLPMPLIILDEAHMVLKDGNKWQRQITADVTEIGRLGRKTGDELVLATTVPGPGRAGRTAGAAGLLRGGNVWSGRTANKVAGGMIGLVKDPSEIPRFFADGKETAGLGYADGPDSRPDAPMRTDRVPRSAYLNPPAVPRLDDRFLEVMDRAMKDSASPTSTVAPVGGAPQPVPATAGERRLLLVKPSPAPAEVPDDSPEGRRCVDAVWQVLSAHGWPLERGEIISLTGKLAQQWGRDKPWSIKAVGMALRDLADGKVAGCLIAQPVKGGPYQAVAGQAALRNTE